MTTIYKYLKHSNTSDIILSQEFKDTPIKGIPINYYRNKEPIDTPDLTGYVEISEKTYKRLTRSKKT